MIRQKEHQIKIYCHNNNFFSLFSAVLASLLILMSVLSYHYLKLMDSEGIRIVNIPKITLDFSKQLSLNKNLNDSQKETVAKDFSKALKESIDQYAKKHKVIVLNKYGILADDLNSNSNKEEKKEEKEEKNFTREIEKISQEQTLSMLTHKDNH